MYESIIFQKVAAGVACKKSVENIYSLYLFNEHKNSWKSKIQKLRQDIKDVKKEMRSCKYDKSHRSYLNPHKKHTNSIGSQVDFCDDNEKVTFCFIKWLQSK